MPPAMLNRETILFIAVPAILLGSLWVWTWIVSEKQQGRVLIPLARRRRVPWHGWDVLLVAVLYWWLILLGATVVRWVLGPEAAEKMPVGQAGELSHPLLHLLGSGNVFILAGAVLMATVVAPLAEEFLFRVVLQGWLEAEWSRRRKMRPGLRRPPASWGPLVLPAMFFALMHFQTAATERPSNVYLAGMFIAQGTASLLTLLLSVLVLGASRGAKAADFGWQPRKLTGDAELGLVAWLAVLPPILLLQATLVLEFQRLKISVAPNPIPLFLLALVLGWLYQRTHRLAPCLVLHMAFNLTSVLLVFLGAD